MTWTPTDEQARELGRVMEREMGCFLAHDPAFPDYFWTNQARAVLVAVGPMIAAQALRDASGDMDAEYEDRTAKVGAYGQTKVRAALLTGAGYARKRADQIEKEAGR